MRKDANDALLSGKNIADKYILLYQVWKELTDFRTLDSYQYKIMNSLSAIKELAEVLGDRLRGVHKNDHNIEECKNETIGIIKEDPVLKKYYPMYQDTLMRHLHGKIETDAQRRALRYQLEYIYNHIASAYHDRLVEILEEDINSGNVKGIIDNADRVVSHCVSRGWSTKALYDFADILLESKIDPNKWVHFKEKLLMFQPNEYHILIPLKIRVVAVRVSHDVVKAKIIEHLRTMKINVYDLDELKERYEYINDFESKEKYIALKVRAFDYFSASQLALSKFANILNLFSFYNMIEAWSIKDIGWIAINANTHQNKKLRSKDLFGTYDYLEGATKALKGSIDIEKDDILLKTRLNSAYNYANMGKASYAIEEKYMNTWVALESLCRSDVYENIITDVLESVPAALCNRYIYRKYRNFVEDCKRCNVTLEFSTISFRINNVDKEQLVKDILRILKDDALYTEFLEKCKVSSLLAERCKELHDMAIDGEKMVVAIQKHYKNVRQQISRLYRIRNRIAHTAEVEQVQMVRYTEHLEDYLSNFVSEIVRYVGEKSLDRVEIVLEMIKDNYKQFVDIVNGKKNSNKYLIFEEGLFSTGIISLI